MKPRSLRTQVVVAAGLVWLYSLGVGASYWVQSRAHARLERSFHGGLTVLSTLPRLRDSLRQLDQAGDQYLIGGQASSLERRDETVSLVRDLLTQLAADAEDDGERALAVEADRRLTAYLAERSPWISRRRAGRLLPAEAARATRRSAELDAVASALNELKDVNVTDLRARRAEVDRAARVTLWLILFFGAAAAAGVAAFLSRTVTGPVAALRDEAQAWSLGRPWDFPPPVGAGPEVADLHAAMGDMARRLNVQFEKEAELGRLKGRLVAMASHEFNNALSVLGGAALLLRQTEDPKTAARRLEYYAILEANLRSLSIAVRNLLDLGRLEQGRFAVKPRRADLGKVLADAAKALQPLHEKKGLDFALELPADAPLALADPEALALVAVNLLGNAIKYTPEGGRVRAGVTALPDGRVRLFVRDDGIGIAPEDRTRVLEGFRTEEGRKAAQGFGVGLTLVKSVLDAHGAAFEITGGPGKGTEVSFVLPLWTEPVLGDSLS